MAKPKKYIVIDEQVDSGLCFWTWEEPQTRSQILSVFRGFADNEDLELPLPFTFTLIQDIWEVRICPVDVPLVLCPECKCPMRADKCPNCGKEWIITI
jgi:hypothetical protein